MGITDQSLADVSKQKSQINHSCSYILYKQHCFIRSQSHLQHPYLYRCASTPHRSFSLCVSVRAKAWQSDGRQCIRGDGRERSLHLLGSTSLTVLSNGLLS